jgi:hypothetical protein
VSQIRAAVRGHADVSSGISALAGSYEYMP